MGSRVLLLNKNTRLSNGKHADMFIDFFWSCKKKEAKGYILEYLF